MARRGIVIGIAVAAAVAAAGTIIALVSVNGRAASALPGPTITCEPVQPGVSRVAVIGDSITAWVPGVTILPTTWVGSLGGDGIHFVGGWAVSGARTDQMAAAITEPLCADVLIVMGGTNDLGQGRDAAAALADVERIVDQARVPTVLISAIAPMGGPGPEAMAYNRGLAALATQHDWHYADPWTPYRAADGRWTHPDDALDGVHPNADVERTVGIALHAAVLAAVAAGPTPAAD